MYRPAIRISIRVISSLSGSSAHFDFTGSGFAVHTGWITEGEGLLILDLNKVREQYVFATLARATANAVVDGIFAVLYNAHEHPVTQDAAVIASAFVNDPS